MKNCLSREKSTIIKGVLILLVILGHNTFFSGYSKNAFSYLYSFHFFAFFILPFFYPSKSLTKESLSKYMVRLLYPYTIFTVILACMVLTLNSIGINIFDKPSVYLPSRSFGNFLISFVIGEKNMLNQYVGLQYLWFLPTMFCFSLLKDYLSVPRGKWVLPVALACGCLCFIFFWVMRTVMPYDKSVYFSMFYFSPLMCLPALGMYFIGFVTNRFINKIDLCNQIHWTFLIIAAIIVFLFYFVYGHKDKVSIHYTLSTWLAIALNPILYFTLIYKIVNSVKLHTGGAFVQLFKSFGERSLALYMIHPIIGSVFTVVMPKLGFKPSILSIIISFLGITIITYGIVKIIYAMPKVRKLLFPKSLDELTLNC